MQAALDGDFLEGLATSPSRTADLLEPAWLYASQGSNNIGLRWSPPNSGGEVGGYIVQWKSGTEDYDGTDTAERQAKEPGSDTLAHTIDRLDNGEEYTLRVMAYNNDGIGVPSDEIKAIPQSPAQQPGNGSARHQRNGSGGRDSEGGHVRHFGRRRRDQRIVTYRWLAADAEVAGATRGSYTLVDADEGKAIKVRVSFTDDRNHQETLSSQATAPVTPAADESAVWSATLTVGSRGFLRGFWEDLDMGAPTTEVFTLDGVDYTVTVLA